MLLPTQVGRVLAQGAICGPFTDVLSSDVFCPFILQAFDTNITQGTSPTTFNPTDLVPREQAVTFFTRTMDQTLHRASVRTAIGKAWSPTSSSGGVITDVGSTVNDIVTEGTYLWIARSDSKILKVGVADRRQIETWTIPSGTPRKLGFFAGQVWIADTAGNLYSFNPTSAAGAATLTLSNVGIAAGNPTLAFDGTNVWWASFGGTRISVYPVSNPGAPTSPPVTFNLNANVAGLVFDGTNMWALSVDSHLLKLTVPGPGAVPIVAETLTLPGVVNDCRMIYDGSNIWIPIGTTSTLYVVRPTLNLASLPSSIIKNEAIPDVGFAYVAAFDSENVMIGGLNNGTVALYKATSLARIRTFSSGGTGIRGIASDGRTFNLGDTNLTKFFQF